MEIIIMKDNNDKEVIEPEVLPPERSRGSESGQDEDGVPQWQRIVGAFFAGLILDIADFATFGRAAMVIGLAAGTLAGLYIVSVLRIPMPHRVKWIAMAALYCAIPRTEFFPLAALAVTIRALRHAKFRI